MKRKDQQLRWDIGNAPNEAWARVRVFDDLHFKGRTIVVLSDAELNKGKSVQNGVDVLCERVCRKFELNVASTTFLVQYNDGNFDVVTFDSVRAPFINPNFNSIQWPVFRCMIGGGQADDIKEL